MDRGVFLMTMNSLRTYLWSIDPGRFQLKQATKTLLAIVLSLAVLRHASLETMIVAGIASGASMQGVIAASLRTRLLHVFVFNMVYSWSFIFGFLVRNNSHFASFSLVFMGFFVNYIRRFGLSHSLIPMMIWLMCFLAIALPFQKETSMWVPAYGLLVGFFISSLMILFFFPDNYYRLFIENSIRFFEGLSQGLSAIKQQLTSPDHSCDFSQLSFVSIRTSLRCLLDTNQAIEERAVSANKNAKIDAVLMHQYALLNAYSLMVDACHMLWNSSRCIPSEDQLIVGSMFQRISAIFSTMRIDDAGMIVADGSMDDLSTLTEKMRVIPLRDPLIIMVILNLKLGLDLLKRQITLLLWGGHET